MAARARLALLVKGLSSVWSSRDAAVTSVLNVKSNCSGLAALVDEFQSVGLQDTLDLAAGVHRPGPRSVKLDVRLPVLESLPWLAKFLVSQGKIVVRVCVSGSQLQRRLVRLNSFLHAAGLIQDIAKVEVGQRVTRVGLDRVPVMTLRKSEFLPVVEECAEVDVSRSVRGRKLEHFLIGGDRLALRIWILFESDAPREPRGYFMMFGGRLTTGNRRTGHNFLSLRKIHEELAGNRFEQLAFVTERHAML